MNVLRFNFTGSQILSHQIEELNAVLDFAMKEYKNPRIFLLGRSMGGAASLVTASRRSEIAGLALWQRRMICTLLLKMRWAARITTV